MGKIYCLAFVLIFGITLRVFSQSGIPGRVYPQNYFRYPLDLPPSTAGSFGELRPNHFHAGLDFKTNHRTGYPVHAAADGYISRLKVQFGGFGNAIYITHPNGYTTVYGHIKEFSKAAAGIVRAEQYRLQSFEVDIVLSPMQIAVCKDEVIALSGNAGASEGPHLHFEIRDTRTEETINAQLFGLIIPDKVPPAITTAAIFQLDGDPFSEKTPRRFLPVSGKAGIYHLVKQGVINLSGAVGFGISTNDMNSVSENHNGVYSIELKLDGKTVYTFTAERFAFDQTHAINAYIDYPEFLKAHRWLQKCFILPGNKISLYPQSINRGIINFDDNALHKLEYVVKDVAGNTSILGFKVKSEGAVKHSSLNKLHGTVFRHDQRNEFSSQKVKVVIQPGNLYDDLDFTYSSLPKKTGTFSAVYCIHNRFTPLHDGYDLWIKPDSAMGKYADKAVIVNTNGDCAGGVCEDGYVKSTVHDFGNYFITADTVPPVILPLNIKNGVNLAQSNAIRLKIRDDLSGIKIHQCKILG